MNALGLVETKGLIAAIEASDVMLKTAEVSLRQKEIVGGGLVTVMVTGDVGAVKTAVDAASSSVTKLGEALLASTHVIPRPDEGLAIFASAEEKSVEAFDISPTLDTEKALSEEEDQVEAEPQAMINEESEAPADQTETAAESTEVPAGQPITEADFLNWRKAGKTAEISEALAAMKVIDLRKLAKKQTNFTISKKDVHKANKEQLVAALMKHFEQR
ncbi:BMC domain-containing protein [Candidatus Enterococcus murrayae]|uniref:BMC domain-containing protein n=1 Tax=Candidatus Enterococcus murrayae TaxID=2815321 RepID=A0ABS3HEN1_9ENTE|nr:BMC domain-containing protein [Enterococcus sp. MJM16]MBO0451917.1 BMC domain-containing protein [Enterococcus sp. MJM16]